MSEIKYILFTTTSCSKCPEVKKLLAEKNIEYESIVVDVMDNGIELAKKYDITIVPTLVKITDADIVEKEHEYYKIRRWFN